MITDRYTKFILTVIALSLTVLAADTAYDYMVPEAQAGTEVMCNVGGKLATDCLVVVVGSM